VKAGVTAYRANVPIITFEVRKVMGSCLGSFFEAEHVPGRARVSTQEVMAGHS